MTTSNMANNFNSLYFKLIINLKKKNYIPD